MIKELTPEEAGRWMDAAPLTVQEAAASQGMVEAIQHIGRAHSLHIDLVGILANLTRYMLIGYVTPPEALQELQSAGVADQEARQILNEVNQSVFMPLHDRIRQGGAMPVRPRTQTPPPPPPRYGPPPASPARAQAMQGTAPPPIPLSGPSPLPPRHILPTPGTPIFHRPMPASSTQRVEPMPPMNLPTGTPPPASAPWPAPAEPMSYEFPPLSRPVPPPVSSVPDGETPHTRYPSDPYREPFGGA